MGSSTWEVWQHHESTGLKQTRPLPLSTSSSQVWGSVFSQLHNLPLLGHSTLRIWLHVILVTQRYLFLQVMLMVSLPFPFARLPLWSECQALAQRMGLGPDPSYRPLLGFMKVHRLSQLWPYSCPQCNKIQKIPRCSTPVSRIVPGKRMVKRICF